MDTVQRQIVHTFADNSVFMTTKDQKQVGIWLLTGAFMVFIQVIIGGITRLTESGLSITQWEVVGGTLPPLNEDQWKEAFNLYKATPEFQKINEGMEMSGFKFIYFWEYFHRLWARLLGFVFLIPFVWFLIKGKLNKLWIKRSLGAFALGGLAGVFGWIMVLSGLQDKPMVSPYRLAIHLSIAIVTMGYLLWQGWRLLVPREPKRLNLPGVKRFTIVLTVLTSIQVLFGALVSGMEAAKAYPTWPDMNSAFIPGVLLEASNWSWEAFVDFNKQVLPHALFQFLHRNLGYLIFLLAIPFTFSSIRYLRGKDSSTSRSSVFLTPFIILLQAFFGIFILITTTKEIPVVLGVVHQAVAIILLCNLLFLNYRFSG